MNENEPYNTAKSILHYSKQDSVSPLTKKRANALADLMYGKEYRKLSPYEVRPAVTSSRYFNVADVTTDKYREDRKSVPRL